MSFSFAKVWVIALIITLCMIAPKAQDVEKWIEQLKAQNPQATQELVQLGKQNAEVVTQLYDLLEEENLRLSVSLILGEIGNPNAAIILQGKMADPNPAIRREIAIALLKLGPKSADKVTEWFANESDMSVKVPLAGLMLATTGQANELTNLNNDPSSISHLIMLTPILANSPYVASQIGLITPTSKLECFNIWVPMLTVTDPNTAQQVHNWLCRLSGENLSFTTNEITIEQVARTWQNWATNEAERAQLQQAVLQLGSMKQEEVIVATEVLIQQKQRAYPLIIAGLRNNNFEVRIQCLQFLSQYPEQKAEISKLLLELINEEKNKESATMLHQIIVVIPNFAGEEAIADLTLLLDHNANNIREDVIWSLRLLQDKDLSSKLIQRLTKEPIPEVRATILRNLALTKNAEDITKALLFLANETVKDSKNEVAVAEVDCAALLNNQLGWQTLVAIAMNPNYEATVCQYAVSRLLPMINEQNLVELIPLLSNAHLEVRALAFQQLNEMTLESYGYDPEENVLNQIVALSQWKKWAVIQQTLNQLTKAEATQTEAILTNLASQGEMVIPYLLDLYPKAQPTLQKQIIATLAQLPTPDVISHLTLLSQSENNPLAIEALRSLAQIYSKKPDPTLKQVLQTAFTKVSPADKLWLAGYLALDKDVTALQFLKNQLQDTNVARDVIAILQGQQIQHPDINQVVANYLGSTDATLQQASVNLLVAGQEWGLLITNFDKLNESQKISLLDLLQLQSKQNLEKLIPNLSNPAEFEKVRIRLAEMLSKLPSAKDALVKLLDTDLPEGMLKPIVVSLFNQQALTGEQMTTLFAKQKTIGSQKFLIQAIPEEELPKQVNFLQNIVKGTYDEELITEAIKSLQRIPDQDIASLVLEILPRQQNSSLRNAWLILIDRKVQPKHLPAIEKLLTDEKEDMVRGTLISCLTRMSYDQVSKLLQKVIKEDTNILVRQEALSQLLRFQKPETSDFLMTQIKHEDASWRKILYENLVRIAADKIIPELEKAISADSPDFSALAVLANKNPEKVRVLLPNLFTKCSNLVSRQIVLAAITHILTKDQVILLISWLPEQDQAMANQLAKLLDSLTGITSGFAYDKQEPAIVAWKNWVQQWQMYNDVVVSLANAEEKQREEAIQKLLAGTDIGRDAVIKALEQAKTVEQKNLWINILARFKDKQAIQVIRFFTEASEWEVRQTAYQNLIQLEDSEFISIASLYYFREIEPLAKITLFASLTKEQQNYYTNELFSYLPQLNDNGVLRLLVASQQLPTQQRRDLLLQILQQRKDTLVLEKSLGYLTPIIKLQDISLLLEVLKKTEEPQLITKVLDIAKQFNYFSTETLQNKKSFLDYCAQNQENLQNLIKAGQWVENYSSSQSPQIARNLANLPTPIKQVVATSLVSQIKNESDKFIFIKMLGFVGELATVEPVVSEYLTSDVASLRLVTAQTLAKLGWSAKSELVQKAIQHQDPVIRFYAIQTIGLTKDSAHLPMITFALSDSDSRVREEALFYAPSMGFNDAEIIQKLLQDNSPNVREQAIKLAGSLKITKATGQLLADLNNPFPQVRKAAYENLKILSGKNFAYDPNQERSQQLENLIKWQSWYLVYQTQQQTQELVEKFAEKDIEKTKLREKIVALFKDSPNDEMKNAVLDSLVALLKDTRPEIRTEVILTLAEIGNRSLAKDFADLLLDKELSVRQVTLDSIQKLTNTQLTLSPIAYDETTQSQWTEAVNTWLAKFKQDEQALIIKAELEKLAKFTAVIASSDQIVSADQVTAVHQIFEYLKNPYLEVRQQAFNAIRPFVKPDAFVPHGTAEERESSLVALEKWLDKLSADAQDFEKELPNRLADIAELAGDLNTPNTCQDLIASLKEFEQNLGEPAKIQQQYVEVLTAKGCNLTGYDPASDIKTKKQIISQAKDNLAKHYVNLMQAVQKAPKIKEQLQPAFSLTHINNEQDLKNAELLVTVALPNLDYTIRQEAINTLTKLANNDFGYHAEEFESARNTTIEKWKNWLVEQGEWLKTQRQLYEKTVQEACNLTQIFTTNDFSLASLLIFTLHDQNLELRAQALTTLTKLAGNDFGYQTKLEPEQQTASLTRWQNWLVNQGILLLERNKIAQTAQEIKNSPKITTSNEVAKIALLVQALENPEQANREVAFEALSTYVRNHAGNQVREDFGYEPKAPEKVRQEPLTHWKKWLNERVQPIGIAQELRLAKVKSIQQLLLDSKLQSLTALSNADMLIESLSDEAQPVRDTAQSALQTISKKNYRSAKQWNVWLRQQKKETTKLVANRKQELEILNTKLANFNTVEQETDVQRMAIYLDDPESELRLLALQWFEKQAGKKFEFDPMADPQTQIKAKANIAAWIVIRKTELIITQYEKALANGIHTTNDLSYMKQLVGQLNSPIPEIQNKAFQSIQTITGKEIVWSTTETKDALTILDPWLKGQEEKIKLIENFGTLVNITTKQDFEKLDRLLYILETHNNVYVRIYAFQKIQEIAKKTFNYQPSASAETRKEAIKEIQTWAKTVEVK